MKIGSREHRDLFCGTFVAGHRAYEPEQLDWPNLEPRHLERLRAVPFWGIAKAMERKAGIMVTAYGRTLEDPAIRDAVMLQGVEEARHARLITHFIDTYRLPAQDVDLPARPFDAPLKEEFIVFGYEECVDFFVGAALTRLASQFDIFPNYLVSIFENIIFEEARHVTFFINWHRYEEARAGRDGFFSRHLVAVKNYAHSIKQLVRSFGGAQTTGFAAAGANQIVEGMTPMMFLEAALAENRRLLDQLDRRLVKPSLLPGLALTALTVLRALPPRSAVAERNAPDDASKDHRMSLGSSLAA